MRKWMCVPMMTLCLLLAGCAGGTGAGEEADAAALRAPYANMTGCEMEAEIVWSEGDQEWRAEVRCEYVPDGETTVEVLSPETIAGVRAVVTGEDLKLEYEDLCLGAGTLSSQQVSPMACLPRLMSALRDGWLLEENREDWNEIPCVRLTVDQSGTQDGKILSTLWLNTADGTPVRGEIAVDDEIILTADFTGFSFYDTMEPVEQAG
ncbi:hypothetical protein [Dysosmobacter sp.]|uniref:hypothetical protein n=1 Tax=Dysosmobacter sp. TaxID=2591382 RepID=UPI003A8F0E43